MITSGVLLALLIIVSIGLSLYIMKFQDQRNYNLYLLGKLNPYKKKQYFLTNPEKILYTNLQEYCLKNNLIIFPQIHLSTILEVKPEMNDLNGKFEWLNKLFVDFVLFDKQTLLPKLVIELNDKTHFWSNRKARDQFVRKSLEDNGVPLLELDFTFLNSTEKLESYINNRLYPKQK